MLNNASTFSSSLVTIDIYYNVQNILRDICDALNIKYKKKIKNLNLSKKDEKASLHKKIACLFILVITNQEEGNMKNIVEEMRTVYIQAHEKHSIPLFEDVQERLKLYLSALDFMSVVTTKIVSDMKSGSLVKNVTKFQKQNEENSKEEEKPPSEYKIKVNEKNQPNNKNLILSNQSKSELKKLKRNYEENFNPSFLDGFDQLLMKADNIDENEVNCESISTMKNIICNLVNIVKIQNDKLEKKENECRQLKLQYLLLKDETDKKFEQYEERLDNINTVLMNLVFNK
jgi:hypothetical protein